MNEIMTAALGSAVLVTLINQIFETFRQKRNRKYQVEAESNKDLENLKRGLMLLMLDRIRYLGQCYIKSGAINYDDRKILNDMHKCYHEGLGGNGDLNLIMQEVNDLQLKI